MLWTTGAEMHVTISSTVAASNRKVPMWWKKPVCAIVEVEVTITVSER